MNVHIIDTVHDVCMYILTRFKIYIFSLVFSPDIQNENAIVLYLNIEIFTLDDILVLFHHTRLQYKYEGLLKGVTVGNRQRTGNSFLWLVCNIHNTYISFMYIKILV